MRRVPLDLAACSELGILCSVSISANIIDISYGLHRKRIDGRKAQESLKERLGSRLTERSNLRGA